MLMNFENELTSKCAYVEEVIRKYLPEEEGYQKEIMEAMNYSMTAGGKRVRPLLMLEAYQMFGGRDNGLIEPFMAAIEMIHTYSLVHDDLPAMDDDEYRRGRKTTHVVYGEDMGILAGDALLNYAFETALKVNASEDKLPAFISALKILARKPGIYGMIGGQVIDVKAVNQPLTKEKLEVIHQLKTSALIECSMMIGAILAGATMEQVKKMEQAANRVGLAFQIQDDVLDVTSSSEVLGKPVHSDEKNNKTTYVTLVGIEKAKEDVESYSKEAISLIRETGCQNEFLEEFIMKLINREK